jgi:hypothetical protein
VCFVSEIARDGTKAVPKQLSESHHDAYRRRAGSKRTKKWSCDAASTLVCQIGEEIDDANSKNKPKGQFRESALVLLRQYFTFAI